MKSILRNLIQILIVVIAVIVIYLEGPKLFFMKKPEWILYYSEACPHCKNVESFIETNKLEDRFIIKKREVTVSKPASIQELAVRARHCGITGTTLSVPFLWTGKECLFGDKPIIDFLNKQMRKI